MLVVLVLAVLVIFHHLLMEQMEATLKLKEVLRFFYKVVVDLVAHLIWQHRLMELVVVVEVLLVQREMVADLVAVEKEFGNKVAAAVAALVDIVVMAVHQDILDILTIADLMDLVVAEAVAAPDKAQEDLVHQVVESVF